MSNFISGGLFRKVSLWMALAAVLALPKLVPAAFAQAAGTASIQGTVSDPTGAVLPNLTVLFTNTDTAAKRSTVTSEVGSFSFANVPVGPYTIVVTAPGFRGFTQRGVLEVGNNLEVNIPLAIGKTDEVVEVSATGTAVDTETTSFKQVIDQQRITELPLNGRQATQLVLVSGAAVTAPTGDMVGSKITRVPQSSRLPAARAITTITFSTVGPMSTYSPTSICPIPSRTRFVSFRSNRTAFRPEMAFTRVRWLTA